MRSIEEELRKIPKKIIWITSYPKSGNTWFRCFLAALFTGEIDINKLNTNGIFSNRVLFDAIMDVDGRLFTEDEIKTRLSKVYQHHAKFSDKLLFIKVHDAYTLDVNNLPIFPAEVTHKVLYLVRNPLDVVASFANHNNSTIQKSVEMMNNAKGYLAPQPNGLNISNQLPQLMFDWSGHVNSWLDQKEMEVITVRYEDMKKDSFNVFKSALTEMELNISDEEIQSAIDMAKFDKLKKKEKEVGFKEKNSASKEFFRKGQVGGWTSELTKEQAQSILDHHGPTMQKLGYEIPDLSKTTFTTKEEA